MSEFYPDAMVRATLRGGKARVLLLRTTALSQTALDTHRAADGAAKALSRLMTGALLLSAELKGEKETTTLTLEGDGMGGRMLAVATKNTVKATIQNPQADGAVSDVVGKEGFLSVVRDLGFGNPYTGRCELKTGEIGEDLAWYLAASEQTPSLVSLDARVKDGQVLSAGGALIQIMPGCDEELIEILDQRAMLFSDVARDVFEDELEVVLERFLKGLDLKIIGREALSWQCGCGRERMEKMLKSLGKDELDAMIEENQPQTVTCHFCRREETFTQGDLRALRGQLPA